MTTSVGDEPAPHHTTKVMMAPHIANGHDGMMGGHPMSHAPLAEAPTSQDLCRIAQGWDDHKCVDGLLC